ncbi:MAG: universal stress protein [Gemmataceae bacterium]
MSIGDESDVIEDVGMFEAAVHAKHVDLELPALDKIVVALDASNQDETARALSAAIGKRTSAQLHEHSGASEAAQVLEVCAAQQAQLLVLPVPFGRDITVLKDESLGDVVDMLLVEAKIPVLCVREVMGAEAVTAALTNVILPVNVHDEACASAAAWAYRLLHHEGDLEVLAVPDRDVLEEARKLLGNAIDPLALQKEALDRAVTHEIAGLIAAVQRRGAEEDVHVHIEIKMGRPVQVVLEQANPQPRLLVIGTPREHGSPSFRRAIDILLGARGPVLIV